MSFSVSGSESGSERTDRTGSSLTTGLTVTTEELKRVETSAGCCDCVWSCLLNEDYESDRDGGSGKKKQVKRSPNKRATGVIRDSEGSFDVQDFVGADSYSVCGRSNSDAEAAMMQKLKERGELEEYLEYKEWKKQKDDMSRRSKSRSVSSRSRSHLSAHSHSHRSVRSSQSRPKRSGISPSKANTKSRSRSRSKSQRSMRSNSRSKSRTRSVRSHHSKKADSYEPVAASAHGADSDSELSVKYDRQSNHSKPKKPTKIQRSRSERSEGQRSTHTRNTVKEEDPSTYESRKHRPRITESSEVEKSHFNPEKVSKSNHSDLKTSEKMAPVNIPKKDSASVGSSSLRSSHRRQLQKVKDIIMNARRKHKEGKKDLNPAPAPTTSAVIPKRRVTRSSSSSISSRSRTQTQTAKRTSDDAKSISSSQSANKESSRDIGKMVPLSATGKKQEEKESKIHTSQTPPQAQEKSVLPEESTIDRNDSSDEEDSSPTFPKEDSPKASGNVIATSGQPVPAKKAWPGGAIFHAAPSDRMKIMNIFAKKNNTIPVIEIEESSRASGETHVSGITMESQVPAKNAVAGQEDDYSPREYTDPEEASNSNEILEPETVDPKNEPYSRETDDPQREAPPQETFTLEETRLEPENEVMDEKSQDDQVSVSQTVSSEKSLGNRGKLSKFLGRGRTSDDSTVLSVDRQKMDVSRGSTYSKGPQSVC